MAKKIYILFLPLLFSFFSASAQDYFRYQRIINSVDDDILTNNLPSALLKADMIYKDYEFIYARHCFKFLQISCKLNDSVSAEIWLKKAFLQGIPKWLIYANELTIKATTYKNTKKILDDYDHLHQQHLEKLNLSLRKTIDSLRVFDKKYTDKVNLDNNVFNLIVYNLQWRKNSNRQVKVLKPMIEKFGFPGERLIGFKLTQLDSTYLFPNLKNLGSNIKESEAAVMLIHYFSIKRKDLNDLLLKNVKSGYLEPAAYASFNDFLGKWGKKKYKNYYDNVWHFDPNQGNLPDIEKRRADLGLETFEKQKEKRKIAFNQNGEQSKTAIILEINH